MKQEQINILKYRSFSEGVISNYSYDNTWQLYDYVYAFFYGFVQNINYIYDDKTIKIGELLSFTEYTYDYSIASMMLGGNKGYSWASQGMAPSHALTSQRNNFDYTSTTFSTSLGARYYDSDLSVWLSVDPLADIAAGISPFAYVNNNPIMLIDEWGLTPRPIRKFKQWLKRRKRGIKVKKVPHVTREVKFKKVVLADGEIDGSIDSRGIMKDGVFLIKEGHNINKYLNNAESFKISFSGASTDRINVSLKKNNRKGKIVFNGREPYFF